MGEKARKARTETTRSIRTTPLSSDERAFLLANAAYEGSPLHKKEPNDFGLVPPSAARPDKTLCDEAGVVERRVATALLHKAIEVGLVSEGAKASGFPSQMWVVDEQGQVFEAIYGGSQTGRYHGYPIRRSNPLFDEITSEWSRRCPSSSSK